jgi:hypothetical protein
VTWRAYYSSDPCLYQEFVMVYVYSDAMEDEPDVLPDKLYWRRSRGEWHCFQKLAQVRGYVSLCQRLEIALVLGQQTTRPDASLRCSVCDGVEIERRGWTSSLFA